MIHGATRKMFPNVSSELVSSVYAKNSSQDVYQMNTFSIENATRTRAKIYCRRLRINSEFYVSPSDFVSFISLSLSLIKKDDKYSSLLTKNRDDAIKKRHLFIPIHVSV